MCVATFAFTQNNATRILELVVPNPLLWPWGPTILSKFSQSHTWLSVQVTYYVVLVFIEERKVLNSWNLTKVGVFFTVILKRRHSVVTWKRQGSPSSWPFWDLYPSPPLLALAPPSPHTPPSSLSSWVYGAPRGACRGLRPGSSRPVFPSCATARRKHTDLFACSCFKWPSLPTMLPKETGRLAKGERKNTTGVPP